MAAAKTAGEWGAEGGDLVRVLWQVEIWERHLAPLLDPYNLLLLACSHRGFEDVLRDDIVWRSCLLARFNVCDHPPANKMGPGISFRLLCTRIAHSQQQCIMQLAKEALEVSSQDRPEESMQHVLYPSTCASGTERDRDACPCAQGHTSCYWSSSGSEEQASSEFITLHLDAPVTLVSSVVIQAYDAWWQQSWANLDVSPVYAPQLVCLEFGALVDCHREAEGWLWRTKTETREMPHNSQPLTWEFERPVLVIGSCVKVHFIGKHQLVSRFSLPAFASVFPACICTSFLES
jgi:hypothetical protein